MSRVHLPVCRRLALGLIGVLVAAAPAFAVVIELSEVGDIGNQPDPYSGSLYGAVAYRYSIGTHDVTAAQYVEFLNAKDPDGSNALRLYAVGMSDPTYGAVQFRAGAAAGAKYSTTGGRSRWPATHVSFYNALRFANWMHNGQGSGDTETGAYTLGALDAAAVPLVPPVTHGPGALWWVPTEHEWYKAAYHKAGDLEIGGWFEYPTGSSVVPNASLPSATPNTANFQRIGGSAVGTGPQVPTDVGAYTGTRSPHGPYDMAGNVFQWTEALVAPGTRGIRGGSYAGTEMDMIATTRYGADPKVDIYRNMGLRLASSLPGVVAPYTPPGTTVTVNTLQAKVAGGKGLIVSSDGLINCGKTCSETVAAGTIVTLTVTPEPGLRFVSWSGACTGTTPSCSVQVFGKMQAQANVSR